MKTNNTEGRTHDPVKNNPITVVISLLLSGIDMYLVESLEEWTKSANRGLVALFVDLGFAVGVLLIGNFLERRERRIKIHSLLWGIPMATAYVLGCLMRRDGTALASLRKMPSLIAQIACLTVLAASCIAFILQGFTRVDKRHQRHFSDGKKYRHYQVCLFYSTVIFLCWLPVFLAYYPSVFAYDAEGQLYQILAHDYSTHHPLVHTLFLGSFFRLGGHVFGSYSAGMAVHSIVQMLLMATAFGYALAYLYRKKVSACLRVVLLLFYALFPANSILALSTTKDVLFSALVLLYTIIMHRMAVSGGESGEPFTKRDWCAYVLVSVFLLLFRNNAVYAFAISTPFIYFGLRRRKETQNAFSQRTYLFVAVGAFVLFMAGSVTLKTVLGAQSGSPREMLSIPLQQMARTRVKAEETLSTEMQQELNKYLPSEWVFAAYNPYLADPVKNRAVVHDDPKGLVRTWTRLGIEHPQTYIDAFLDNSIGYWFLEDKTHAQIYGIGTESGFGYLSTDNRTMPAGCEIVGHSYLPALRAAMERVVSDNVYQNLPLIRLIFAPAFYWWMLCMYMAVAIYRREYILLLPAAFLVVYYLTLLLSPTVLIRYMYPFVVTVPAICCCLSTEKEYSDGKNIQ